MHPDEFDAMIFAHYARGWRREQRLKRLNSVVRWLLIVAFLLSFLTLLILFTPN